MPYKSQAQERWAHTKEGTKALGGPDKVKEWDSASKGAELPDKVHPARAERNAKFHKAHGNPAKY